MAKHQRNIGWRRKWRGENGQRKKIMAAKITGGASAHQQAAYRHARLFHRLSFRKTAATALEHRQQHSLSGA
jgi:hypothetical protein